MARPVGGPLRAWRNNVPDQQGGSQQAGGSSGQAASNTGGDVRQMSVGDLLDLANQQNLDIAPVTDLLNNLNLSPDVSVSGTGNVGGGDGHGDDYDQDDGAE
jgi:hypothetical protein